MPSYMLRPPAQQASMQTELEELARQPHDLEATELEVEKRTGALNLDAVRDAIVTAAAPVDPLNPDLLVPISHLSYGAGHTLGLFHGIPLHSFSHSLLLWILNPLK